jgi:protein associated with RNAse G/E
MQPTNPITVIKTDHTGHEVWRYQGVVLERGPHHVILEARFNRDDLVLNYVTLRRGDRFVETFYDNRWYNVFEVHDKDDDRIKGSYYNFARPAHIVDGEVCSDDLALDLWVYSDGRKLILDQDEFDALPIDEGERAAVLEALRELQ